GDPAAVVTGEYGISGVAVDATGALYWTVQVSNTGTLRKMVGGSVKSTLASNLDYPAGVAVDPTGVYVAEEPADKMLFIQGSSKTTFDSPGDPVGVAIDSTYVYYTSQQDNIVWRKPKAGGTVTAIGSRQDNPSGIGVNDSAIYWVNLGTGDVMR